jgi:site-specific recombinase XerD
MKDLIDTLATQFQEYLRVDEDRMEHTLKGYKKRLAQFARWADEYPGDALSREGYRAYMTELKSRGLSPYTRKGHYHILKRFGDWLVAEKWLQSNPIGTIRAPRLPRSYMPKAIAQENFKRMLSACLPENYYAPPFPSEFFAVRDRALLMLFRDSGGRAGEVITLKWGQINLETGLAITQGKGDTLRKLFFKDGTGEALETYRAMVPHGPGDPVWLARHGKELGPMSCHGLNHVFYRLGRWAEITGPHSPHSLRHAFGRDTHRKGAPTAVVQDLMGHSSIRVTKIYSRFDDEDLKAAHNQYSPTY